MFGDSIDYRILRPLTHSRNLRSEDELAARQPYTLDEARAYLDKARKLYFGGRFPIDSSLSYLDLGCGLGEISIALGLSGARDVTGIDIIDRNIATAKTAAQQLPADVRPDFRNISSHDLRTDRRYDVIIALGVMEHIDAPDLFLRDVHGLLKPEGRAYVSTMPFHGPFGDHMSGFFRIPVPWRGVLFSERAVLRLRAERFRPDDPAVRYQDIDGGLNLMTVGEFFRYVDEAGLYAESNFFDPHFRHYRRLWPIYPVSWMLTRAPKLRDYFTFNVYSILRRRGGSRAER